MGVRQCPGWEVQSHQEICGPRGREAQGKKESPKVGVGWQLNNGNCMMCKFPPLVRTGPGATCRGPSRGLEMLLLEGWQEGLV